MVKIFLFPLEDIMGGTTMRLDIFFPFFFCFQAFTLFFSLLRFLCHMQVNVLKPSHKSTLQSKMMETQVPDSVSAVQNLTNATRDIESDFETGQEGKTRENILDSEPVVTLHFLMTFQKYLLWWHSAIVGMS
jgi:hypothetical protein